MIHVQNVSKLYRLYRAPVDRLRELLPGAAALHTEFWALRDVAFSVEKGETLALVKELMAEHAGEVRTVTLYAKSHSIIEPDYVWKRTDRWITFPWSALPPVTPTPTS